MRDLVAVWRNTRMVVLVALTAGLYAAVLIPFKVAVPIVPGVTELRPANAIPIVCSLLFGPAAAWGSAFGNLIGDFFGTLTLGSFFGFIGNFLYGYLPYRAWAAHRLAAGRQESGLMTGRGMAEYVLVTGLASLVCAVVIGWGCQIVKLPPGFLVANIVVLNNFLVAVILGPPVLLALYPRVRRWGLLHWQILGREPARPGLRASMGVLVCWGGAIAALVIGNQLVVQQSGELAIIGGVAPAMAAIALGALLI
jgi:energy-coupling factor transport system substrate-specific component